MRKWHVEACYMLQTGQYNSCKAGHVPQNAANAEKKLQKPKQKCLDYELMDLFHCRINLRNNLWVSDSPPVSSKCMKHRTVDLPLTPRQEEWIGARLLVYNSGADHQTQSRQRLVSMRPKMRPPRRGRLRITPCLRICSEESSEVRRETRAKTSACHSGCLLFLEWALSDPFKVLLIINFITRRSECTHPFLFPSVLLRLSELPFQHQFILIYFLIRKL